MNSEEISRMCRVRSNLLSVNCFFFFLLNLIICINACDWLQHVTDPRLACLAFLIFFILYVSINLLCKYHMRNGSVIVLLFVLSVCVFL